MSSACSGLIACSARACSLRAPVLELPYVIRCLSSSAPAASARGPSHQGSAAAASQDALVDALQAQGLLSDRAAAALRAVDRAHFVQTYTGVPGSVAYQDTQLPISCGQHMPPPNVVARFLTLLEPHIHAGARVLDVGAGTGYVAACLAHLAAPGGVVMCLEKQAKLVERAKQSLQQSCRHLVDAGAFEMRVCNARADPSELQGIEQFDAIHVGASVEQVPGQFVKLLRPGGRLVLPVGAMHGAAPQALVAFTKESDGSTTKSEHGTITTRIAPLTAIHDDQVVL